MLVGGTGVTVCTGCGAGFVAGAGCAVAAGAGAVAPGAMVIEPPDRDSAQAP